MANRRKRSPVVFVAVFILLMGVAPLTNAASSPGFAAFRAVDVVRLVAAGMCFGAGLATLVLSLRRRDDSR